MAQVIKDALPVEGMKTQAIDFFKEIPVKSEYATKLCECAA